MHIEHAVTLLLFALGAFLVPLGTNRIGVPAAVGEILYGIVVGPQLAGLVHLGTFTTVLAELGFCFLMFLVGLELDFAHLERVGKRAIGTCVAVVVLIFFVAHGFASLLGLPRFMVLVLGAMSVGILLATLSELGHSKTPAGQLTILAGSLGELVTIVLLTGFGLYHQHGFGLMLVWKLGQLGLVFLAAYVLLVLLRVLIWWAPDRFARMVTHRDPSEIGVRAAMATMLVFVALASMLGVEAILGAFIAGALFSFVFREKGVLETKLASIGFGFFVPLFFIAVGAAFDLSQVLNLGALGRFVLLLVASLMVKLLPSLLLVAAGLRVHEAVGAALLLASPLTLLVAISRLGASLGLIDAATASAVVLLAVGSALLLPWVYRRLLPRSEPQR